MLFITATVLLAVAAIVLAVYLWKFRRPATVTFFTLDQCNEVEIDGHRIRYCQKGEGKDLLLIHGLGSSMYCWVDIYEPLAKNYRVTALDLPGFGQSDKFVSGNYGYAAQVKRIKEFCDKLELSQLTTVGCSMGGTLALGLAFEHPQLVKSLVLISPAVDPRLAKKAPRQLAWILSGVGEWAAHPLLVQQMAKNVFRRPEKLTEEMIHHYYSPYHRSKAAVVAFWKAIDVVRDFPHFNDFQKLEKPTLLLFGEHDRITPWSSFTRFTKQVPSLVIRKNPDGGHHLMEDQPDFVIGAIKDFLGSATQQI